MSSYTDHHQLLDYLDLCRTMDGHGKKSSYDFDPPVNVLSARLPVHSCGDLGARLPGAVEKEDLKAMHLSGLE